MDPVAEIAAEGAQAQASLAPAGALDGIIGRLTSPSPRSEAELQADAFAKGVNSFLDTRVQGRDASESQVGEGVMDCVYALLPAGGGLGGSSPLGRLLRAVGAFVIRMLGRSRQAQAAA